VHRPPLILTHVHFMVINKLLFI